MSGIREAVIFQRTKRLVPMLNIYARKILSLSHCMQSRSRGEIKKKGISASYCICISRINVAHGVTVLHTLLRVHGRLRVNIQHGFTRSFLKVDLSDYWPRGQKKKKKYVRRTLCERSIGNFNEKLRRSMMNRMSRGSLVSYLRHMTSRRVD